MRATMNQLRRQPFFGPALGVPAVIALIFSLFNLTAPPDPERIGAAISVGVVNLDEGMKFPPLKVGNRLIEGMSERLPVSFAAIDSEAEALAGLDRGEVSAVVVIPATFTRYVLGTEKVPLKVATSDALTLAEAQIGGQLPQMLEAGVSAAVASIRLAVAQGRLPNPELPVDLTVDRRASFANAAARVAPFVASYATWLSALVGAVLLFLASRGLPGARDRGAVRTVLPVAVSGLAALILALLVAATAGLAGGFWAFWLAAWALGLALAWLFAGALSLLGLPALLLLVPAVFYQIALGGTQMPAAAAPAWLVGIAEPFRLDMLGAMFRRLVVGGDFAMPWGLIASLAATGLALIWVTALLRRDHPAS